MPLTKEERDNLKAELARSEAREKESEDQKWLRGAMKDAAGEALRDMLGLDEEDEDDPKAKKASGGGFSITSLFGDPGKKRTA